MVRDVHRLAKLSVRLMYIYKDGVIVHIDKELFNLLDVEVNEGLDRIFVELKEEMFIKVCWHFLLRGIRCNLILRFLVCSMLMISGRKYYRKPIVIGIPFNRELPRCSVTYNRCSGGMGWNMILLNLCLNFLIAN